MTVIYRQISKLEPIQAGHKVIASIVPQIDLTATTGDVYALTEWPVGTITVSYTNNTVEVYGVSDSSVWDIDNNFSDKVTLSKADILSEFLKYGILNSFDYDLIFSTLPQPLVEVRGRLTQLLAIPDTRFSESSQKAAACRAIRGYLVACKLADVFGLTSYRRSMNSGATSGDFLLPTLTIGYESNLEYVYSVSESWTELLDSAELFLIKSGFNKALLQATNSSITHANKYKNIARAIVLLFASGMFIR